MMHDLLASATVFLLAWIGFSRLISRLWRISRVQLRAMLTLLEPQVRANFLRLLALSPVLGATTLCAALYALPGLLIDQHCHMQVCAPHTPVGDLPAWSLLLSALIALLPTAALAIAMSRTTRITQQWRSVSVSSDNGHRVLPTTIPVACAIGVFRPTIYLSRGLLDQLPLESVTAILAHEHAHTRRHDNLWMALLRACSLFWTNRTELLSDIELAHDQCCDRAAAEALGEPLQVAEALMQCQRLANAPTVAASFLRGHLGARIEALLRTRHVHLPLLPTIAGGCLMLSAAALAPTVHYLLEVALVH